MEIKFIAAAILSSGILWALLRLVRSSNGLSRLYADGHLRQIRSSLYSLRRKAMETDRFIDIPKMVTFAPMIVCYSIEETELGVVHHLSISTPVSSARVVGAYFLAYIEALLRLDEYPGEVMVSKNNIFHLVRVVPQLEHRALRSAPLRSTEEAQIAAGLGRKQLMRGLKVRQI